MAHLARTALVTVCTSLALYACGASTTDRKPGGTDAGPDAAGGKPSSGGAGGANGGSAGASGGSAGASGGSAGASGGSAGASGGSAGAGGTDASVGTDGGTDASVGADASADGGAPLCAADGVACSAGDARAVCCGGRCVSGDCCAPSDCGAGADGGAGFICSEHRCVNVAGSLSGLTWLLPCTSDLSTTVCNTNPSVSSSTVLGGPAGVTYDVALHLRGIVEQKTYTGGCGDGYWQTGGADDGDTYNVYQLDVSSPKQRFFLNRGASSITNSFVIDYVKTVRMDAGATVTLSAFSKDDQEIRAVDPGGTPLTIAGTSVPQPYDGQFIQMDVVSVIPSAVASGATVGGGSAGSALSFDGTQQVTIADAASLAASDVTLEAWFQVSGTPGSYNTILGKAYQGGSADSFTIWYQSGALNSGAGVSSPSGAASVPWSPTVGEWHHSAMTYDSAAQRTTLYVDGLPVSCVSAQPAPAYDTHPMLIGADIDNGAPNGFWSGTLDEVRLFKTARTAAQIWADMHTHALGPTTGLVGEWTFDEGAGQVASDSSSAGNAGTLGATSGVESTDPTWVTSTVPH
jgi:hypothetical protein